MMKALKILLGMGTAGAILVGGNALLNNQSPSACTIKGNISSSSEKIYHMPNQQFYSQTEIDAGAGERWFCSESEATTAGWRKSKR